MSTELANRRCVPCDGNTKALQVDQVANLMSELHEDWSLSDDGLKISRKFDFPAYSRTLGFANAAAWVAIAEGHHPVLTISYGSCQVSYTTHAIDGLSDSDFICAAKIDRIMTDSA